MIKFSLLIPLLFLSLSLTAQVFPVEQIMDNGPDAKRINFVILGDGYTNDQLDDFTTDANNINNQVFNKSPFKEYSAFFNTYIIKVPSNESGADHPGTATDVNEPSHPVMDVDNYFGSTFDFFDIHRLLVPVNTSNIYSVLADNYPGYDQVIVLTNSHYYGGSGGALATTSLHASAPEIAIHEIGHSFGGLADEYWAGDFYANERPNMTANSNPSSVKWSNWVGTSGIDIYVHGNNGVPANWYRPHQNCEMRYLNQQFCAVCRETFIDKIYLLTDPIDSHSPTSGNLQFWGFPLDFSIDLVLPSPNTLKTEWILDGNIIATDVNNISIGAEDLPLPASTLKVQVIDTTQLSRSYLPASGYVFSLNWTINNNVLPVELVSFSAMDKGHYIDLAWTIAQEQNIKHYEIERSEDGINFDVIERVSPLANDENTQNYLRADYLPLPGRSYYRLKMVALDDHITFSPLSVINRVEKFFYKIFPNPVDETLFLQYYNNTNIPEIGIEIRNSSGQVLTSMPLPGEKGSHQTPVDLSAFPSGVYFVRLHKGEFVKDIEILKQ
jgi:hypothetical protein